MDTPGTPPPGSHIWTVDHKVLLCVLSRYLKVSGTSDGATALVNGAERVLCRLFAAERGRQGASPWLTYGGIRRMLYELHRKSHETWRKVFVDASLADPQGSWNSTRQTLIAAAADLGIQLVRRKTEHPIAARQIKAFYRLAGSSQARPAHSVRGLQPSTSEPIEQQVAMPVDHASSDVTSLSPMTPTAESSITQLWDEARYERAGRFAYRVFSSHSHSINTSKGCYAGQWTGPSFEYPLRSSQEFLEGAKIHLRPLEKPSPFLSATTSLFWALRLALHLYSTVGDATILVINLQKLRDTKPPACVTPTNAIIKNGLNGFKGNLRRGRGSEETATPVKEYNWRPMSEMLIWMHIPSAAIMKNVDIASLHLFLANHPTVDNDLVLSQIGRCPSAKSVNAMIRDSHIRLSKRVGRSVGSLLAFLGLSRRHVKTAAQQVRSRWNLAGLKNKRATTRSIYSPSKYRVGVAQGYEARRLSEVRANFVLVSNDLSSSDTMEDSEDVNSDGAAVRDVPIFNFTDSAYSLADGELDDSDEITFSVAENDSDDDIILFDNEKSTFTDTVPDSNDSDDDSDDDSDSGYVRIKQPHANEGAQLAGDFDFLLEWALEDAAAREPKNISKSMVRLNLSQYRWHSE